MRGAGSKTNTSRTHEPTRLHFTLHDIGRNSNPPNRPTLYRAPQSTPGLPPHLIDQHTAYNAHATHSNHPHSTGTHPIPQRLVSNSATPHERIDTHTTKTTAHTAELSRGPPEDSKSHQQLPKESPAATPDSAKNYSSRSRGTVLTTRDSRPGNHPPAQ